jgi:hypothetical protein
VPPPDQNWTLPFPQVQDAPTPTPLADQMAAYPRGQMFVSPNTRVDMTFPQAQEALGGDRQRQLHAVHGIINDHLGIPAQANPAIGAWEHGAENSLHSTAEQADPDLFEAGAAMQAHLADQKQALVFREHPEGEHFLAQYHAPGHTLDQEHDRLLKAGVMFHTLRPTPTGVQGHVFGFGPDDLKPVAAAAQAINQPLEITHGTGTFIGSHQETGTDREQRDDALRDYEARIQAGMGLPGERGRKVSEAWTHARHYWDQAHGAAQGLTERRIDPEHMLDWDRPLSRQSQRVQEQLHRSMLAHRDYHAQHTGEQIHQQLGPEAHEHLLSADIPGVRYWHEGEHKYIVFDPHTRDVIRRHGLSNLIAQGADALREHKAKAA